MSPLRVRRLRPWVEYSELATLFFLQAMATSMWYVPLGVVLVAQGLGQLRSYAFATTAAGALVSPLIFGAMADRHVSPVKVLRGLAAASALCMVLVTTAIKSGWNPWLVLLLIQILAFCSTPTTSIVTAIVFSGLRDSHTEYGPVRSTATFGWMCGCWLVSLLNADASWRSGYVDAAIWLALAAFTFALPAVVPPKSEGKPSWRQRMGWDALALLKNHDHKVVFITTALFWIPLSAFYPYTPPQLMDLGLKHTSAWMTLGQTTEIIAMFAVAALLTHWRLKWIFAVGLAFGVVRFALCALNTRASVLAGVSMHGLSLVMVLITAQVYTDQRVDPSWRVRGQALLYLMTSGVGNLIGFLGTGWWFNACARPEGANWASFWSVLSGSVAVVLAYFLFAYRGIGPRQKQPST